MKYVAYALFGIEGLSLLLIICYYKSIRTAVSVIEAAADFVTDVKRIVVIPILMMLFIAGFLAYWIATSVFLMSSGEFKESNNGPYS